MHIDYHTHHERCGHAVGKLEEYVQRGIELGLQQLGLSDHLPLIHVDPASYYPEMAMPMAELPRYVEECLTLKERYRGVIDLRVGLEADYIEGYEEQIREILSPYPWDYLIGSVHFLGEWDITDHRQVHGWEGRDALEVYRLYYDAVKKSALSGLYDIIGHMDVIKRFGYGPQTPEGKAEVKALELETLKVIADSGIAMELNASGLTKPCAEMFPAEHLLQEALRLGIPLTLGSDAHDPAKLGDGLQEARSMLWHTGFRELAVFEGRRRTTVQFKL
ncbi:MULTISPECIES: histidinol-phosphatase HisJ [Paenibacillus]|uniref:histidinol-phosphatase HisJ n=1 Tax=Paenibacillus TaxID=44249 RepID=UPI00096F299B|nr:histidinol-phosphatase HisJ [Paenibacillus odorifer]MEC0134849.1 histidinol-phosphatase HisJ [Paenibacillus odorifer]MEC0225099.1 histidinol-phosphatase HisJ [Paenibacillus odorifer]OMC98056.1 histidinol-phosphatase [Paenibacillus odorifer]OMD07878.1 histidinol-phosphatase [Paenibacillus odorifer]OMD31780.1 histidinol-phosphatase [Paenibacillus odorifer]